MFERLAIGRAELEARGRKVVRKGGKQILLIASAGRIYAIANRCPHQGYPLSEGTLGPGCVLTCDWHNWKYDLATGEAKIGRDPVRAYPVRLVGDAIEVDLADPPAEQLRERALAGLLAAMADNDRTRIARETARLEHAGFDARIALVHAITATADRLEGGMTHAHAAAADWLGLSERAPSADLRLTALLEPLGHLADDVLGAGRFPYPVGETPWDATAFVAAVEAERAGAAQRLVAGALAEGLTYADLRSAFAEAALAHYADFGHSAIYVLKAGQLIDQLGDAATAPLLQALIRQLIYARREERLPEFRGYAGAVAAWDGRGRAQVAAEELAGQSVAVALRRTVAASGRPPRELYDALVGAAAWNLLHFDLSFDRAAGPKIDEAVSWLDFTHALTFANAARRLCEERPDLWPRALLQLALFIGRNKAYVDAGQDVSEWRVGDADAFIADEMAKLYDHGESEPIVACHRIKVLFALEDELAAAPHAPWRAVACAAVNRYLNTPMKRHHGVRVARQARSFVAKEG